MRTREVRIVCYAYDATLIVGNEDNLHRLFFVLLKSCKQFGLTISTSKTKALTIKKELFRCKLEHILAGDRSLNRLVL